MEKVKTLFIGTSNFAVPILREILNCDQLELVGVVTQPDRPVGRKQVLTPPPIKKFILDKKMSTKVFQPSSIKAAGQDILKETEPELVLVASYGQIIPEVMLAFPKYGCLNFHGSLLPKLRGAVPVQMAILKGFEETGVTLQVMSKEMDKGGVVSQQKIRGVQNLNTKQLMSELSELSAAMICADVRKWVEGDIEAKPQDEGQATYCYQSDIAKENAEITSEIDVARAERMIRAFYPWPVAWIRLPNGKRLKIFKAEKAEMGSNPGVESKTLFSSGKELYLQLKDGSLKLLEVQLEGKKKGAGHSYLYLVSSKF